MNEQENPFKYRHEEQFDKDVIFTTDNIRRQICNNIKAENQNSYFSVI